MEAERRLRGIRELAGYVEDGSCQAVTICQDDATRDWVVLVERKSFAHGRTFEQAIDAAISKNSEPET